MRQRLMIRNKDFLLIISSVASIYAIITIEHKIENFINLLFSIIIVLIIFYWNVVYKFVIAILLAVSIIFCVKTWTVFVNILVCSFFLSFFEAIVLWIIYLVSRFVFIVIDWLLNGIYILLSNVIKCISWLFHAVIICSMWIGLFLLVIVIFKLSVFSFTNSYEVCYLWLFVFLLLLICFIF